jgi:hypothetical protein
LEFGFWVAQFWVCLRELGKGGCGFGKISWVGGIGEAEGSAVFCGGDVGGTTYARLRANLTIRPEDVKKKKKKKKRGVGFRCVSWECVVFVGIERELPQRGREFVCMCVCVSVGGRRKKRISEGFGSRLASAEREDRFEEEF